MERSNMWFIKLFLFIRFCIDRLIDYLFGLYYCSLNERVQAPSNLLVCESVISLSQKIRKRTISCEQVVQAYIDRIREVNKTINAVVDCRFETAIEEAKAIDSDIKNGTISIQDFDEKPFLGIPFTTKESTACEGMRNTFGLIARKDKIARDDADIIMLMKKAGAILIGVTNMPQLNMWQETSNPIYGRTNNPYNFSRTVGGSCGGDSAIIAAGGVPFAVGTDIGGSIRIPAFMCGIFGHKPTNNLIPTKGLTYRTGLEKVTMVTAGTLTKSADDIKPLLKVLANENAKILNLDQKVDVTDIQVYYVTETVDLRISPFIKEMESKILEVVKYFAGIAKRPLQVLRIPNLKSGGDLWRYWMRQEENSNLSKDFTNRTGEVNLFLELSKKVINRTDYNIGALLTLLNEVLPIKNKAWVERITEELVKELTKILDNNAVLIYPSAPWTASYHNSAVLRPWNFYYFAIWNALKFPVTQVPIGLDSQGLPVGIQVVAAPYQDHLCIAVAKELEKAFGGYVPPFNINN